MATKVKQIKKPDRAAILPTYVSQAAFVADKGSSASDGEMIYNSSKKNIDLISGGITRNPYLFQRIQVNNGAFTANANVTTALAIDWIIEDVKDDGFSHSTTVNPSEITIEESGLYRISYKTSFQDADFGRKTIETALYINGVESYVTSTFMFIYNSTDKFGCCTLPPLEINFNATDVLTLRVLRRGSSGTCYILTNECFLRIEKMHI